MGKQGSIRSKAVHFVSDLTTNLLNPISDKPSSNNNNNKPSEDLIETKGRQEQLESVPEDGSVDIESGPDTSSFTAFLYSLLTSSESGDISKLDDEHDDQVGKGDILPESMVKENSGKKGLFSRGKQSLGRAFNRVVRVGGYRSQEKKGEIDRKINDMDDSGSVGVEMGHIQLQKESEVLVDHPEISEPSMLLSEKTRDALYASLPALVKGRRWLLLYSTWRHGISLSTMYRRSMLWPGLSLLVVGDSKGAAFGGLVESPLRTNNKRYQGTNSTFVFTNKTGQLIVYRPTGANRYYTLCATDSLAIGGGGHFALYLDGDLLSGSSSVSETYGNPCLAQTENFEVKDVELWGFVYNSKYDEILKSSKTEAPGICRW